MSSCFDYFRGTAGLAADKANIEEFGTDQIEIIELIKGYHEDRVAVEVAKKLKTEIQSALPAIQERERENAIKEVRKVYRLEEGTKISGLSCFISETVTINGVVLYPNSFISDKPVDDPINEDVRLYFDDTTERWLVRVKNGLPKLISRFVVIACIIVDVSGPGSSRAYVVFLKGETKSLIFWNGNIEEADLRRQTQFHQKGLSYAHKELYHESFMRALRMCRRKNFLTLPTHAGWNLTPEGLRVFVDSAMMRPEFEGLFLRDDAEKRGEQNKHRMHNISSIFP